MNLLAAVLAAAATVATSQPTPAPDLGELRPAGPCIARVLPSLYLGGPLEACPEPRRPAEPQVIPLDLQSFIDE